MLTSRLLVVGAAVLVAASACSSSSSKSSVADTSSSASTVTVKTADVAGLGTVLVNGSGMTLYSLSSEAGGKITCTDANGCTKIWPTTELPSGVTAATAGAGLSAGMLGTAKGSTGDLYTTYAGYPLYTFVGDTAAGQAHGIGINSFGGIWAAMGADGTRLTSANAASTSASTPASSGSSGGGGYGY